MIIDQPVQLTPPKICPFLAPAKDGHLRKCISDKCMMWVRYDREKAPPVETCVFLLDMLLSSQQIVEQSRGQAAMESLRNEMVTRQDQTVEAAQGLLALATGVRRGRQITRDTTPPMSELPGGGDARDEDD